MSLVSAVVVAAILVLAKKAVELTLENEYASWAPALARLWVSWAGFICRSRRQQWSADLQYVQRDDHISGLIQATSCLVSSPFLAIRDSEKAVRARRRSRLTLAMARAIISSLESERSIETLGLSDRTARVLRAHRFLTVDQLRAMKEEELLHIRNFGRAALDEVKEKIVAGGFIQPS